MYEGDLTGEMSYVLFNRRSGRSALAFSGIIVSGEDFLGGELGWNSSFVGTEMSWDATEPTGQFDFVEESHFDHVLRVQGSYSADGIMGTWTLEYDRTYPGCDDGDRNCATKTGTFDIPRTVDSGGSGGSLCGAIGGVNAALLILGMVGVSRFHRLRRR